MKIILSRKGFDSSNGGIPSPILPDGTMLSLPIPSIYGRSYTEMYYKGWSYKEILANLGYTGKLMTGHLDPDIRSNVFQIQSALWKPLFGQVGQAQGVLRNRGVSVHDLFLFFGTFRRVDENFHYLVQSRPKHLIYGYFQIGGVIHDPSIIRGFTWHPHAQMTEQTNNVIYTASESLSTNNSIPGHGVLTCSDELVLTKGNKKWYIWDEFRFPFLKQNYLLESSRKFSESDGGIMIADKTGQEYVYSENDEISDWAIRIIENNSVVRLSEPGR